MWKANVSAAFLLLAAMQPPALAAQGARIGEIRERLENADRWRDHVMVVAHRGGGSAYAELSYEATAGIN